MKKPFFLIGALIWVLIALSALALLAMSLSGASLSNNLPNWMRGWSQSGAAGSAGGMSGLLDSNTLLIKEEAFDMSGIDELDVGTRYQSIKIAIVDGAEMAVRHYDIDPERPFASEASGGSLKVYIPERSFVSINMSNPRLEIDLPAGYIGSVKLASSSGDIDIGGRAGWGAVALSSTSGAVRASGGIDCGAFSVSTNSGTVSMGDVGAQSISIISTSGSQRLSGLRASGDVFLKSASGTINSGDIEASGLKVQSTSGTIRADKIDATGSVSINSSSGNHNIGAVSAVSYEIESTSGTLRYDGLSGAGSVDSSSGSLTCGALDVKGDVAVATTSGTVRLALAPEQNFELKITVSSGTIRASRHEIFYTDRQGKNAFGTVGNGGAATLSIRTSSGNVNID